MSTIMVINSLVYVTILYLHNLSHLLDNGVTVTVVVCHYRNATLCLIINFSMFNVSVWIDAVDSGRGN